MRLLYRIERCKYDTQDGYTRVDDLQYNTTVKRKVGMYQHAIHNHPRVSFHERCAQMWSESMPAVSLPRPRSCALFPSRGTTP